MHQKVMGVIPSRRAYGRQPIYVSLSVLQINKHILDWGEKEKKEEEEEEKQCNTAAVEKQLWEHGEIKRAVPFTARFSGSQLCINKVVKE